jgi:hypothetical protein
MDHVLSDLALTVIILVSFFAGVFVGYLSAPTTTEE